MPFVETDEDDDNDGESTTALGLMTNGSDATTTSTMAVDRLVKGSNAPPASTTALGLLADGSNLSEEGDTVDAGSVGNVEAPVGNGAMRDSSIPPWQ